METTIGKFITFEGGEGAGKSTQAVRLSAYLIGRGLRALVTREPGGTTAAEILRDVILDPQSPLDALTEVRLYCAARASHVQEVIGPALSRGEYVICDRFSDSTAAYQAYGRGLPLGDIANLNKHATGGTAPDITFFLDLPPAAGFKRKGGASVKDRMESAGAEFHERVYKGFCELAAAEPERIVRIDATQNADAVHAEIVRILTERKII